MTHHHHQRTRPKTLGALKREQEAQRLKEEQEASKSAPAPSEPAPNKPRRTPKFTPKTLKIVEVEPEPTPEALETPVQAPQAAPTDALQGHHSIERSPEVQAEADEAFRMPYTPPMYAFNHDAGGDPMAELASRELSRRHLLPFIQRFRPKYQAGWVHADICRRFERFLQQVENGEEPRLLLMMPPRSGKSEISSRHYAAWVLGHHPEWEIIAASHTASLTMSFSRYLRDLMSDEAYTAVFPDTVLDQSSRAVENWNLTKGGGYLAAGVGTGITGRGAHILLLDDLVKDIEAADSLTIRDNTWEWYISTAYTRLAPGGGVLGLMTWWHEDDWAGRIQQAMEVGDGDKFEIVKYPAINEVGDEYILEDDTIIELPQGAPVPQGARMTRPHMTAIHPERYSTEAMLRIKRNAVAAGMKRTWDALYQQNPVPDEGNYFSKEHFRFYSTPPARRELYVYQAWDFAISTGKESDFTVCCTIGVDHRDAVYVLDVRRFKSSDGIQIAETIVDYFMEWGADCLGVEDGQIWKSIESQFTKACEEKRSFPSYEVLKPLTDKMVRANPLRGRMQAGKVYFDSNAHWWRDLQKEMLYFPAGKHDDQCFVAGTLIEMADGSQRPIEEVAVGDEVVTPYGARRVYAAGKTSAAATVYSLEGRLIGTAGHPVWTENRGWVGLSALTDSDILQVRESQETEVTSCLEYIKKRRQILTRLSSTGAFIAATRIRLANIFRDIFQGQVGEGFCTEMCGNSIMARSPLAVRYTTLMGTISTTVLITWNACLSRSTAKLMPKVAGSLVAQINRLRTSKLFETKLKRGTAALKELLGIVRMVKNLGKSASRLSLFVKSAVLRLQPSSAIHSSAQSVAKTGTGTKPTRNTALPRMLDEKQPVFNLSVDDAHCYFANGVLVHNCDALAWAIRLTLTRHAPQQEKQRELPSWKSKLNLYMEGAGGGHMAA